jgi:hypothetical protein
VEYLRDHPQPARTLGKNGRAYVLANFQWPQVVARYKRLIATLEAEVVPHV